MLCDLPIIGEGAFEVEVEVDVWECKEAEEEEEEDEEEEVVEDEDRVIAAHVMMETVSSTILNPSYQKRTSRRVRQPARCCYCQ